MLTGCSNALLQCLADTTDVGAAPGVQGPKDGSIPISSREIFPISLRLRRCERFCSRGERNMKLRTFAERIGVRYETAWRWYKAGKIKGRQLDTGTIIITEDIDQPAQSDVVVVVYARVSANENRPNLDTQAERLSGYYAAKGWKVHKVVKEVGSGINDWRKK